MSTTIFRKAETTEVLHYATLTQAVNEVKSPNSFLKNLLFQDQEPVFTDKIELSVWSGDRQVAPFVLKNGEAVMVDGYGESFHTVEPPNIRIKRAIDPWRRMNARMPGFQIFPSRQQWGSSQDLYMQKQLERLADLATNAEEYLCALAIRGVISYSVSEQAVFQITYPKPAGNNVTLTTTWDDPDPSVPEIESDFDTAKRLISDEVGLVPTDVILGSTAARLFKKVLKSQKILDMLHYTAGEVTLQNQYRPDGAILLGNFCGINVWSYPRTVSINGSTVPLVRANYAEFVCAVPAAENRIYYGPIADEDALEGDMAVTQRFSKSWVEKDPSQRFLLLQTRPLPCTRRPGSIVSMQVSA